MTMFDDREDGPPRAAPGGATDSPAANPPGRRRTTLKLVLALGLFVMAGGLFYSRRGEWAEAFDTQALAGQRPGPKPSAPDFDLERATIPRDEIRGGGPPKDGIPALTEPATLSAGEARYLKPTDRVAGLSLGGEARAYPLRILTWHEVVNDTLGGSPVAVTYCPLCDSVVAFDRRTPEGVKEFGVSGLLYNSNVLLYDRGGQPEALWSQLMAKSVSGAKPGTELRTLPVEIATWAEWRARHPGTTVLSPDTGHGRDYGNDPYAGYFARPGLMFPVRPTNERLPEKARVLGVWLPDGTAKAYPVSAFGRRRGPIEIRDDVGGRTVTIGYDPASKSLRVVEAPEGVRWAYSFWFAWYAFHPETALYESREE